MLHPAGPRLPRFPLEPNEGAQHTRVLPLDSHLILIELTEELHHFPNLSLLARNLMDQRQVLQTTAQPDHYPYIACPAA